MKTLLIIATLISGFAFGQTNIIAAKSHSSTKIIDKNDRDNFGNPVTGLPILIVCSVEYLKPDCIVEKCKIASNDQYVSFDTICDHPFLKEGSIDVNRIKAMYPESTKFINFDKLNNDEGSLKRTVRNEKPSNKSGGAFWLIFLSGGLFLMYLFSPKFSLKTS